ncbi:peptide chain release factor N(5)-glutamine methyltransferase [Glacieibacterium frigidum]|uniref:Release factor glutamine methyltransferase n=1 Tax=Glacieibacterium frigidum TaxID=2593303 RepID=A0A552UGI6_9SPHN|nr:peptide chain release factor N(5)-glutamine methyltransferase [Glacieibacterium frigidum]TRW17297.1 peptide chain release factor N(5)-glutamine methyltransferase [Glacieibacterium frigidum]
MRAAEALRAAASRIDRLDAEVLLAHAARVGRMAILLDLDRAVPPGFDALVERRAKGEPVAYITGSREFWSLDLQVTPEVLIPRPDSETLIEAAIAHFGERAPDTILDLGTGSGALLLAALDAWPGARGVGIDASPTALAVAAANAARLRFGTRATFAPGGWDGDGGVHDLILCNPPYIATSETLPRDVADWEPHDALFAGPDGLDDYRHIVPLLSGQLTPHGVACIEIGATQAGAVARLLEAQGLTTALRRDLAGLPRCLVVTK